jgi:hypothetical protein
MNPSEKESKMKTVNKKSVFMVFTALSMVFLMTGLALAQAQKAPAAPAALAAPAAPSTAFTADLPVAMTCPGQAPEGELVKILFDRLKTKVNYDSFLEPKGLAGNKSLIIIIGGSGKGLGAAGVDPGGEVKRAEALIAEAKKQNMKILGFHLGGEDRRGTVSAKFIDIVTPKVNYLVVREDGNKDGAFTKIAQQNKIPFTQIKKTTELTEILKAVFNIK